MPTEIRSSRVSANGVDFALLECGEGPLALCLHGFPDSAHTWRHLLPRLADAGYRAVAPFMRGYAPTSVPDDGRYQTGVLGQDAIALHDVLGGDADSVIIGHDWGAIATTAAAVHEPGRWRKVVSMAVPPGPAVGVTFLTNLDQIKRSWYMFFFQHDFADMVVPANDLAYIDMLWRDWSPGHDATEDLALLKPSLRDPANLTAALGYYTAHLTKSAGWSALVAAGEFAPTALLGINVMKSPPLVNQNVSVGSVQPLAATNSVAVPPPQVMSQAALAGPTAG